jgi:fatty-acyl-CoA synthase
VASRAATGATLYADSPQYVIGYYAILRADAVVVPVNPMNRGEELRHCLEDTGAATLLATHQELWEPIEPLLGTSGLARAVLSAYSDYPHRTNRPAAARLRARAARADRGPVGLLTTAFLASDFIWDERSKPR